MDEEDVELETLKRLNEQEEPLRLEELYRSITAVHNLDLKGE